MDEYIPNEIESRWRERWERDRLWRFDVEADGPGEKFYNLVEFPYPSAEGLHVGSVRTYAGADAFGRYQRMRGRRVFQPMGFDSSGIHTENYAIRVGEHPARLMARTIPRFREQLSRIGCAWDWSRQVITSDPSYYRWTQWVFLRLLEAGLAYRAESSVVWCPSCLTVLAFEQLEGDRCERCSTVVTERVLPQWFIRMTRYADALVDGLDALDWPDWAKRQQRDWIGRSRGAEIDFREYASDRVLTAFTTRPDTLPAVTFLAVAPVHASALARTADLTSGSFTGRHAIHPMSGERIPVLEASYVIASYGTGVVMGVPAHDERDAAFAQAHGLPVSHAPLDPSVVAGLEPTGIGRAATRYRLRDWLISRQRYWGPPIPIVHCEGCGPVGVPDSDLPVLRPDIEDFRPTGTGLSPLATVESFVHTTCPSCHGPARRETDVSDTFLDSAWYFMRYPCTDLNDVAWSRDRTARLLPVDQYEGGREHVARHHLYARFTAHALYDLGLVDCREPLPRLSFHGLMVHGGAKMSKSRGNVVTPDEYIDRVGADSLRMYLLFTGPWESGGDFSDDGLNGFVRFTRRLWRTILQDEPRGEGVDVRFVDRAIARVGADIGAHKFNTAIAHLMELTRWAGEHNDSMSAVQWRRTSRTLVLLLAPFAPHLAEELWFRLGEAYSVHQQGWPSFDAAALDEDMVDVPVQVDGRVRDSVRLPAGAGRDEALAAAMRSDRVRTLLRGAHPRDVIWVQDRILNLVTL
jgi:leucyl-tRNA synthetase